MILHFHAKRKYAFLIYFDVDLSTYTCTILRNLTVTRERTVVEIISWPNLFEKHVAGPGFELATPGL